MEKAKSSIQHKKLLPSKLVSVVWSGITLVVVLFVITITPMIHPGSFAVDMPVLPTSTSTPVPSPQPTAMVTILHTGATTNIQWEKLSIPEMAIETQYPTNFTVKRYLAYYPDAQGRNVPQLMYIFESAQSSVRVSLTKYEQLATVVPTDPARTQAKPKLFTILGTSLLSETEAQGEGVPCSDDTYKVSSYYSESHRWTIPQSFFIDYIELTHNNSCNAQENYQPLPADKIAAQKIIESIVRTKEISSY